LDNDTAKMLDENPEAKRAFLKAAAEEEVDKICAMFPGESRDEIEKMFVGGMLAAARERQNVGQ
jgi:hypothetical protein